jgi:PPM family protein phosphatase
MQTHSTVARDKPSHPRKRSQEKLMKLGWIGSLKKIAARGEHKEPTQVPAMIAASSPLVQALRAPGRSLNPTRVLQPAHTLRLRPLSGEGAAAKTPAPADRSQRLAWHGISETGMVREQNEDNFAILSLGNRMLLVVADGMGGHDAGEVASRIAIETVCSVVRRETLRNNDMPSLVERAVLLANDAVRSEAEQRGSDMGTTLSMALVSEDTAYIANIGDSRVYWIENGSITQVTTDHSLVAKLVELGKISRAEARGHPRSNLLYRTIGGSENVKIDTFRVALEQGGTLLLCTDGLWGEVTDEEIHKACSTEKDATTACTRLVKMANENGGKDNITAVAMKVL